MPIPLKADDVSSGYPIAGLVFLAVLLGVAVWARWRSRRVHTGRSLWHELLSRRTGRMDRDQTRTIAIESASVLDATTRLYAVVWRGHHLLLAKTTGQGVAVLVSEPAAMTRHAEVRP